MEQLNRTFFTSDHHFGHANAVARPVTKAWGGNTRHQFATVEMMNKGMIDAWNLAVPDDGTVYVLGDFVYNGNNRENNKWVLDKTEEILDKLKGEKHLIVGNHDLPYLDASSTKDYIRCGFETVTRDKTLIKLGEKAFELCHFPRWRGPKTRPEHYPEPIKDWNEARWLLHGHSHGQIQQDITNKMIDIGVDAWSFRPVAARTIIAMTSAAEELKDSIHEANRQAPNTYTA